MTHVDRTGITRLGDLTATQWKSGAAAWLGWLFDGLDMNLYTLVATPFVAELLDRADRATRSVELLQLLDSGGVSVRLGAGGQLLRPAGRSASAAAGR